MSNQVMRVKDILSGSTPHDASFSLDKSYQEGDYGLSMEKSHDKNSISAFD